MPPALEVAALSSDKLSILSGPPNFGKELFKGAKGTVFEYAPCGGRFVQCDGLAISLFSGTDSPPKRCDAQAPVARVIFSPTGAYFYLLSCT